MNYAKRAVKFVQKNIGKNLILLLIIGTISSIIFSAILVSQQVTDMKEAATKEAAPYVSIDRDYEKISTDNPDDSGQALMNVTLTEDQITEISKLDIVQDVFISASSGVIAPVDEFETYIPELTIKADGSPTEGGEGVGAEFDMGYGSSLSVTGQNKVTASVPYYDKIKSEYNFTQEQLKNKEKVVVLNKEFMELNNLKVGDTIEFAANTESYGDTTVESIEFPSYEFKIVGQYTREITREEIDAVVQNVTSDSELSAWFAYDFAYAIAPVTTIEEITNEYKSTFMAESQVSQEEYDSMYSYMFDLYKQTYFKLDSLDSKPLLLEQVIEITGDPYFTTFDETDELAWQYSALFAVADYSVTIIIVTSILLIFIISLVVTLFIRGRKKEIGILISLGETKRNIYLQLLLEMLIVTAVGLTIAIGIGYLIANSMANLDIYSIMYGYGGYAESTDKVSVSIGFMSVLYFYLAGFLVAILSTALPTIYTLRLKPKNILL